MTEREAVRKSVELISELHVLYDSTKNKIGAILPVASLESLYNKFHGTELGETLKPLNKADVLLGEISPYLTLFTAGVIDEDEVIKRFDKRSERALGGISIIDYVTQATVYLKAYSNPLNSLDEIMTILSAKFMNPEIIPC